MAKKQIVIDAPKHPVIRFAVRDSRHIDIDFRGIRNPHKPLHGRLNPTKGGGRRYLTPEHLQCMVQEYFESCNGPMFNKNGYPLKNKEGDVIKTQVRPYTISGLALYLGVSTQTLKHYREGKLDTFLDEMRAETEDRPTFSRVVLQAKQTIEAYAEGRLYDKDGQRGAQFVLDCCFNWVGHKESSDIAKAQADVQLKREEFDLKKRLLDEGAEDGNLTINIIRGKGEEA